MYTLPFEANLGQLLFFVSEVELLLEFPELLDIKKLDEDVKNMVTRLGSYFVNPSVFDPDHLITLDFITLRNLLKKLWNIQNFINEVNKVYMNLRDPDQTTDFTYL